MNQKNFLAIDWGKAKIGVALAHAETRIAVPYGIWPVDENLWGILEDVLKVENIGTVVLGDPEHPEKNIEAELVGVENKLKDLGVSVVRINEMFTTKMAQAARREAEKKFVSASDDAEAAKIMLSDWLDRE